MATTETPLLTLTETAAAKVEVLMAEEPEGEVGVLRVAVQGGGCAGLEYALGFDERALEGDVVAEQHGVQIVIDPYSAPYLDGAIIDLVTFGDEEGFSIENPNAPQSCGCGSSFRADEESCSSSASGCGGSCGC
ncbi:MAG: iron-sulfur cluster assembly accessory protein [Gaiellaceae bacterium]